MVQRRVLVIFGLVATELVLASIISPVFATTRNASNVLLQLVVLGTVSVGQAFVLLTGGIDLSVGSVIALSLALTTMWTPIEPGSVLAVVGVIFLIGAAIGALNAALIVQAKINPFIVTLAMLSVIQGVVLILRPMPSGSVPRLLQDFSLARIGPVPVPVFVLVGIVALGQLLLSQTQFGRHLFALGGNEENAALSGVRVARVKSAAYIISSLLAALSGVTLSGILGSADPLVGTYYPLESVTASVIGGMSLAGGEGNLFGVLAGVLFIAVLRNIMNLRGIPSYYQLIAIGVIFGVAMALASTRARARVSAQKTD